LFPLDVTVSLSTLAGKYRSGGIVLVPFRQTGLDDVVKSLLFAIPLGALCVHGWTIRGRRRSAAGAMMASIAVLAALEACQVIVVSRVADVTDILTGGLGAAIGVWLAVSTSRSTVGTRRPWEIAFGGVAVSAVLYAIVNWSPFDFLLSRTLFETRWPELIQVPFKAYYDDSEVRAIGDFAGKFGMAFPVGLFTGFLVESHQRQFRRLFFLASAILAAGFFLTVEIGQIFLPSRFPDVTDVFIAMLAFVAGLALPQALDRWRQPSTEVARKSGSWRPSTKS
jgi:glycopeptide antibiotics resistance protein